MELTMQRFCDIKITKEQANQRLAFSALCAESELKSQSNGGKYLLVKVRDKGREDVIKFWNANEDMWRDFQVGHAYDLVVDVKPYSASPTGLSLIGVKYQESAENPANFAEWAPDIQARVQDILTGVETLKGTKYGTIVSVLLQEAWASFIQLPAAVTMHHTEQGGLAWHSASVYRLALEIGNHFEKMYGAGFIDFQLLTAGAIIHDIGKTVEYKMNSTGAGAEYSSEGLFGSHLLIGYRMIDRVAMKYGLQDTEEVKLLEHMMASHHGNTDWGALVEPITPEAKILSVADELDASMWRFHKCLEDVTPGEAVSKKIGRGNFPVYKELSKGADGTGTSQGAPMVDSGNDGVDLDGAEM